MREILFRGKRVDNGEWVEGQTIVVIHQDDNDLIFMPQHGEDVKADIMDGNDRALTSIYGNYYQILPETVEQFTGLTDKNGKKIFEGDVVKVTGLYPDRDGEQRIWRQFRVGEAFYYHGAFFFGKWGLQKTSEKCIEIIGNVHDNPELLEVAK